jgi:tRNA-2-methylthio-N6-dimethylallyladenosine synthase
MPRARKVFVKTYGCQMNEYDSERMTDALGVAGYSLVAQPEDADLVVLNTCHIRERAAEKVYSELGRLRVIKGERHARGEDFHVAVAGCVAQAEGAEIIARAPVVDLVVGPQSYHKLPDLLACQARDGQALVAVEFPDEDKFAALPPRQARRNPTAFLTIQEGCDKFCTFCVVPYTRGMEYSRPAVDLVGEARRLVDEGVREITLLGQNVNAYHGDGGDGTSLSLADLIGRLAAIEGLERLRYTTSHPRDLADDLIDAHGSVRKLMPFLHLPIQSGADRILAAMNRKHTRADYEALVTRLRRARPDIALSTDFIVGFPTETEAEFEESLDLIGAVGFAQAYSFKYSARPGTPAAKLDGQLTEAVKAQRLKRLQSLLAAQSIAFNGACVGRTLPVLFDRPGRRTGQIIGRSPYLQSVHAEAGRGVMGQIVPVEISGAGPNSLSGIVRAL